MSERVDWIEDAAHAGAELRLTIVQAHEASRDLKRAAQDVRDVLAEARADLRLTVNDRVAEAVRDGLLAYGETLQAAIDKAEATVNRRFDTVANILLGKEDDVDFEELALRMAEVRRPGKPGRSKR